jgi:phage antirepressor YoqD-like protein
MNKLSVIEHKNQRVLTTQQIAEAYETDILRIRQNYVKNQERYQEGKHFYKLTGEALKEFKKQVAKSDLVKQAAHLMLWTEKGALLHAKSLNTDKAWEVYDQLVETYFKAREMFTAPRNYVEALEAALTLAKQIEEQKPLVIVAQKMLKSNESILIGTLAKLACEKGYKIGRGGLFKQLRDWGILDADNMPYQRYMKYFEVIERPISTYNGVKLRFTTKVTPEGQAYILNRLAA